MFLNLKYIKNEKDYRKVEKRSPRTIKCEKLIESRKIIENCSNCWITAENGLDVIIIDTL